MKDMASLVKELLRKELNSAKFTLSCHSVQLEEEELVLANLRNSNPILKQEKFLKDIRSWVAEDKAKIALIERELESGGG